MRVDTVVLATHNRSKLAELRRLAETAGLRVLGLDDVASYPEPAETERTFEGNAFLKASAAARETYPLEDLAHARAHEAHG